MSTYYSNISFRTNSQIARKIKALNFSLVKLTRYFNDDLQKREKEVLWGVFILSVSFARVISASNSIDDARKV